MMGIAFGMGGGRSTPLARSSCWDKTPPVLAPSRRGAWKQGIPYHRFKVVSWSNKYRVDVVRTAVHDYEARCG